MCPTVNPTMAKPMAPHTSPSRNSFQRMAAKRPIGGVVPVSPSHSPNRCLMLGGDFNVRPIGCPSCSSIRDTRRATEDFDALWFG